VTLKTRSRRRRKKEEEEEVNKDKKILEEI